MNIWVDYWWRVGDEYGDSRVFTIWNEGIVYNCIIENRRIIVDGTASFERWKYIRADKRFLAEVYVEDITFENIVKAMPVELLL